MLDDVKDWIEEMRTNSRDVPLTIGWLIQQLAMKIDELEARILDMEKPEQAVGKGPTP